MTRTFLLGALLLCIASSTRLSAAETSAPSATPKAAGEITVDSKEFEVALEAAGKGDLAPMKALLAAGFDVNKAGKDGTPLMYATVASPELVELFIAKGADVNWKSADEMTALKMSVIAGDAKVVQLLLRHGARVNDPDKKDGETVLMSNIILGNLDVARVLLKNGANVNAADATGDTALMLAASLRRVDMVRLFLHAGADVTHKNKRGETALSDAKSFLLVGDLLGRSAKETPQERASRLKGREVLDLLEAAEKRARNRKKSVAPKGTR